MAVYRRIMHADGSADFYAPFRSDFVLDLQTAVPRDMREYCEDERYWHIYPAYVRTATLIADRYFDQTVSGNEAYDRAHDPKVYGDPGFDNFREEELKRAFREANERWRKANFGQDYREAHGENPFFGYTRTSGEQYKPPPRRGSMSYAEAYAFLEVRDGACIEVVEAAYKALVRKYHPDLGGDGERLKTINAAMDMIRKVRK